MRQAISIIIPSYNGKKLLQKNLPSVLVSLTKDDELIIVDDNSDDSTLHYLSRKFKLDFVAVGGDEYGDFEVYTAKYPPTKQKKTVATIKLIYNLENLRFAASVNRGVQQAHHSQFLLINSDVSLQEDTINNLLATFNNHKKVFAVGCLETEPNQGNIQGGKNKLFFKKGLFMHSRADEYKSGKTAWASGGSALLDRAKWLNLKGFDTNFYPAYWEDIDLSYRANQKGWLVLFDEQAKVIHNHESTNQPEFGQNTLAKISWRNADRFTAKHSRAQQKLQYWLRKPYWWLQRFKSLLKTREGLALVTILLLAAFLRFYKLAQVPAGMTWDEAAIGYNGYAVIKTRHDEWLNRLPISFKSFGDYKAPLAIYLVGIFTVLLDLNLWTIRLPFVIAGVLAVLGFILLTQELLELTKAKTKLSIGFLSLLAGLALTISPWHLHFSRTGFESGLALSFIIWGTYFLCRYLKKAHVVSTTEKLRDLLPAAFLMVSSLYTYHSAKIFVPLLLLAIFVIYRKKILRKPSGAIISAIFGTLLLLPLIKDSLFGEGMTRAGTLLFTKSHGVVDFIQSVFYRLGVHFSPQFLVGGWTDTLRHGTGRWGVLLTITFLCFVAGMFLLIKTILATKMLAISVNHKYHLFLRFSFAWLIIGLVPAILGSEFPHPNRALLALPGFLWMALIGLDWLLKTFSNNRLTINKILIAFGLIYALNIGIYLRYYYHDFAQLSAGPFNEGCIEAMELAYDYERGVNNKPEVNQIVVSKQYGQIYIYSLLVRKTNPIWYQGGSLIKYLFVDEITDADLNRENSLVVATKFDEVSEDRADYLITTDSGEVRFKIYHLE